MLFVCLGVGLLRAQTRQVTGVVTAAEDGLPVAGASILVKGSSQGTITDVEGRFVLSDVPASATTLVISFVGMKSCEVPVSDRVEVVLENEQQVLDEVLGLVDNHIISEEDLLHLLDLRSEDTDVILTGRVLGDSLLEYADSVYQICVKKDAPEHE